MIRTQGNFVPFLTSPISAVFLLIAVMVVVAYVFKSVRANRRAKA